MFIVLIGTVLVLVIAIFVAGAIIEHKKEK
jgi:hypothetical protein